MHDGQNNDDIFEGKNRYQCCKISCLTGGLENRQYTGKGQKVRDEWHQKRKCMQKNKHAEPKCWHIDLN